MVNPVMLHYSQILLDLNRLNISPLGKRVLTLNILADYHDSYQINVVHPSSEHHIARLLSYHLHLMSNLDSLQDQSVLSLFDQHS